MGFSVDYRDTLVTYLRSQSLEDAAHELGITLAGLNYRLEVMRKHGVKVPKKNPKLFNDLFVAQLNSLVKQHTK